VVLKYYCDLQQQLNFRNLKEQNKIPTTYFRRLLIDEGKYEKTLNDVGGEWYEFKVTV
jgi:hypothetical protein